MWTHIRSKLNFYRIHLLCFTICPILSASVFWASNGEFKIRFVDALFVCVSAVTGTGLVTIDLSSLTPWQQVILAILEIIGNQVFVAWIVVYVRRRFFLQHLGHIVVAEGETRLTRKESGWVTSVQQHNNDISTPRPPYQGKDDGATSDSGDTSKRRIDVRMVRRVDVEPCLVNPMGVPVNRSTTIHPFRSLERRSTADLILRRTGSGERGPDVPPTGTQTEDDGFGGFPGPRELIVTLFRRLFPSFHKNLHHTLTIPRTATLVPHQSVSQDLCLTSREVKEVPYLSFMTNVGRNSRFPRLSDRQLVELGGVEYQALNTLLWIVPMYYFGILAICIIIVTPYISLEAKWESVLLPPQQHKPISPIWYSIFQVIGAWANTGMSLVDQNMVPFRTAYLLILVLIFCVLAGNTAFPIFFRFTIWLIKQLSPKSSRTRVSLQFLLDHPRRCFITLFPSHQTWLLLFVLFLMNTVLFWGDLVLNIGNPTNEAIPIGTRIILAFLSAAAVRSSGFQAVPISALTPAIQVLYVIMMYIAIYPIAMSVRATNVYEENSLGIYEKEPEEGDEDELADGENRVAIWGKYLMRHAQRQLSFDMWWLALSLFLICIIERHGLSDPQNSPWLNTFSLIFELVSAYGTVGLSLGIPTANCSLSGGLHTLSKLIICVVMLRGRHRGLPVALDRAVMLPREFKRTADYDAERVESRVDDLNLRHGDSGDQAKVDMGFCIQEESRE